MNKTFTIIYGLLVILALFLMFALYPKQVKLKTQKISHTNDLNIQNKKFLDSIDAEAKLLFVGDVMLARSIGEKIQDGQNPFKYVQDIFNEYDLVIINLETSIGDVGSPQPGKLYTFRAPVKSIEVLKKSGVDVVSLANNHIMDFGDSTFLQMIALLEENKIKYFGAGENQDKAFQPLELIVKGNTIHLHGFNDVETHFNATYDNTPGNAWFNKDKIISSIQKSKSEADLVIPFVHWGKEFSFEPNSRQKELSSYMIDAGSDIVVGGHPHVVQPTEQYKEIQTVYSLGNFVFDEMYLDAAEGNMLEVVISDKNINSTRLIPIKINNEGFPELTN